MAQDDLDQTLRSYRFYTIIIGMGILAFGIVRAMTQAENQDPLVLRFIVVGLCFAYSAATCFDTFVRRSPAISIAMLAIIVMGFIVYLAYLTGFSGNSSLVILLTVFLGALAMQSLASLALFLGGNFVVVAVLINMAPESEVDKVFFISTLIATSILTLLSQKIRLDTEHSLREAKELAQVAAVSRSRFLANMSHEIRTPMNGVIGMAQILNGTDLQKSQQELVGTILQSGDLLLSIINNVLEFSKIDAGQVELECIEFNLRDCVKHSVSLVSGAADLKNLDVIVEIDPMVPDAVIGDRHRLSQVLVNLTNNAIKFTERGTICIEVSGNTINKRVMLWFKIKDTGAGIAREALDTLFDEFTQEDTSTTRKFGGTGLGLAISKNLAEKMGGTIRAESVVGVGSTFTFSARMRLPIESEEILDHSLENPAVTRNTSEAVRVLLAEDNKVNQVVALKTLEKYGLSADLAVDGQEALDALRGKKYDLVFMDLQMPKLDGLEVTRKVRAEFPDDPCQIIALTANAFAEDRDACFEAGMNEFLAKPIQLNELEQTLNRVLPGYIEGSTAHH